GQGRPLRQRSRSPQGRQVLHQRRLIQIGIGFPRGVGGTQCVPPTPLGKPMDIQDSLLFVIEWGGEKVMDQQKPKHKRQLRRRHHVRSHVRGTTERPRLTVFRSSKHILVQIIDDLKGITLVAASSQMKDLKAELKKYGGNVAAAKVIGKK